MHSDTNDLKDLIFTEIYSHKIKPYFNLNIDYIPPLSIISGKSIFNTTNHRKLLNLVENHEYYFCEITLFNSDSTKLFTSDSEHNAVLKAYEYVFTETSKLD
jgi:hypothetical protein